MRSAGARRHAAKRSGTSTPFFFRTEALETRRAKGSAARPSRGWAGAPSWGRPAPASTPEQSGRRARGARSLGIFRLKKNVCHLRNFLICRELNHAAIIRKGRTRSTEPTASSPTPPANKETSVPAELGTFRLLGLPPPAPPRRGRSVAHAARRDGAAQRAAGRGAAQAENRISARGESAFLPIPAWAEGRLRRRRPRALSVPLTLPRASEPGLAAASFSRPRGNVLNPVGRSDR